MSRSRRFPLLDPGFGLLDCAESTEIAAWGSMETNKREGCPRGLSSVECECLCLGNNRLSLSLAKGDLIIEFRDEPIGSVSRNAHCFEGEAKGEISGERALYDNPVLSPLFTSR